MLVETLTQALVQSQKSVFAFTQWSDLWLYGVIFINLINLLLPFILLLIEVSCLTQSCRLFHNGNYYLLQCDIYVITVVFFFSNAKESHRVIKTPNHICIYLFCKIWNYIMINPLFLNAKHYFKESTITTNLANKTFLSKSLL